MELESTERNYIPGPPSLRLSLASLAKLNPLGKKISYNLSIGEEGNSLLNVQTKCRDEVAKVFATPNWSS